MSGSVAFTSLKIKRLDFFDCFVQVLPIPSVFVDLQHICSFSDSWVNAYRIKIKQIQ